MKHQSIYQQPVSDQKLSNRRGSVIVVVLALLGALTLLGMLFYTLAGQQQVNAEYFSDSAKISEASGIDPETFFDWGLRQLIVGPADNEYNSALWGGRKSLLPTMFGLDITPYNGSGIHLAWDNTAQQTVIDLNHDGVADVDQSMLELNDSPGAQGAVLDLRARYQFAPPDVPYTYPDINNLFLSHTSTGLDPSNAPVQVVIPSFTGAPLMRRFPGVNIHTDPTTSKYVLRPHISQMAVDSDGTVSAFPRFLTGAMGFPFTAPNLGIWKSLADANNLALDADPSATGINDSIWVDLGFPVQTLPDGTKYIPMFSMKVVDADGLLNLNAIGNVNGNTTLNNSANPFGSIGGTIAAISRSHNGLSASEINPLPALITALPATTATVQHNFFFGRNPASPVELANMEWWWLLKGRGNMSSSTNFTEVFPGRWGEVNRLEAGLGTSIASRDPNIFSGPGETGVDDNRNALEGNEFQDINGIVWNPSIVHPAFRHPLDIIGRGHVVANSTSGRTREFKQYSYLRFANYHDYVGPFGATGPRWAIYRSGQLMETPTLAGFTDEPAETIVDEDERDNDNDALFPASEDAGLHLSNGDIASTNNSSRLRSLLPYTFSSDPSVNPEGQSIRQRFTTTSWSLMKFAIPYWRTGGTPDKFRTWLFNADADSDGNFEFPPVFTSTGIDPFRSELRELLFVEQGERAIRRPQRKFSINGLLERYQKTNGTSALRFRPLTPHPLNLAAAAVVNPGQSQPSQISSDNDQEWWARRDRQLMARDIYVMLYTFGGENDTLDYTASNASNVLYTNAQMKQMAQFAVNLVDSLDADDTITQFVYDKDLSDGWTANEDGYSSPPTVTDIERGMVRGVEEHQLSFSESMAIFTKKVTNAASNPINHNATEYDDREHRDFLGIELENSSPHSVMFDKEAWQIVVIVTPTSLTREERRLTLTASAPDVASDSSTRYAIATMGGVYKDAAGTDLVASQFSVDENYDTTNPGTINLNKIAPVGLPALDLIKGDINAYRINKKPTTVGNEDYQDGPLIVSSTAAPSGTDLLVLGTSTELDNINLSSNITVTLKLRRRLNLHRLPPDYEGVGTTSDVDSKDNPWITVDTMTVPLSKFILNENDDVNSNPTIATKLQGDGNNEKGLFSREREEPLSASNTADFPTGNSIRNSLGNVNDNNPAVYNSGTGVGGYTLWQPHFDRDFGSVVELFAIPLYGPDELLTKMGTPGAITNNLIKEEQTAGSLFLHPDVADASGKLNRWHRILEFIEVPSRQHRHSHNGSPSFLVEAGQTEGQAGGFDLGVHRVPAKINLNTVRHPQVLSALLGDNDVMNSYGGTAILDSQDAARDWWVQFLASRDGADPYPGWNGAILPGGPRARPFRNINSSQRSLNTGDDPLQDTILRRLPLDNGQSVSDQRGLFEVGTQGDHTNKSVDITLKHKLLGKVMNNSTHRSNVFYVFMQVDFFEATEQTAANGNKVHQIGQKLGTSPGYRGFFVVDRSKALEMVTPANLPPAGSKTFSFDQSFNYRALIRHRQIIK